MPFWRRKKKETSDKLVPINIQILIKEKRGRPAMWDITLEITNNTEQARRWGGVLNVDGEVLETPLGVRIVDKRRVAISNIVLQPREKLRIKGIIVQSPHMPQVLIESTPQIALVSEEGLKISVEKMVDPSEGGLFEVKIQIANESRITITQLPFRDRIPSTFEVDWGSITPRPDVVDTLPDGSTLVAWTLDLKPNEKQTLIYRVRARTLDAKISELYKLYPS